MAIPTPCELIALHAGALYECAPSGKYVRIRTPYLYPDGDVLDLYWRDDSQIVTDVGETLRWLDGQTITDRRTKRHMQLIDDVCANHRVNFSDGMLFVSVPEPTQMAAAITRLAQACVRVSDLWFTFRTRMFQSFPDEVEEVLLMRSVGFQRGESLQGQAKTWRVDFHVKTARSDSVIFTLSTGTHGATRRLTEHVVTACVDLGAQQQDHPGRKFISLFDDTIDVWSAEDFKFVEEVSEVQRWSRPDEFLECLAA